LAEPIVGRRPVSEIRGRDRVFVARKMLSFAKVDCGSNLAEFEHHSIHDKSSTQQAGLLSTFCNSPAQVSESTESHPLREQLQRTVSVPKMLVNVRIHRRTKGGQLGG